MFGPNNPQTKILLRLKSCREHEDETGGVGGARPSPLSTCITVAIIIFFFMLSERLFLFIIETYVQKLHPIFDDENDRRILARHLGVDIVGSAIVAYLGYSYRHLLSPIFNIADVGTVNIASHFKLEPKGSAHRIYSYVPEGHHILIYFMAYQLKNTYDSWVWKDGILFMIHHALAMGAAWSGLYPGVAQIYGIFFMGMSEISTVSLCLLGNFDPDLGVAGLAEVFPTVKLVAGLVFVVTFIIFRILFWPIFAHHFFNDMKTILERDASILSFSSKVAMIFLFRSCQGLSLMQVVFLGQILLVSYEEIMKML